MTELKLLAPADIAAWEGRLRPFLERACSRSRGRYSPEHVLGFAKSGIWQIWIVLETGAISFVGGTELLIFPTGLKGIDFRFGTGSGRERWQCRIDDVLAWAKGQGCEMAEGVFRKGWRHVLAGWTHSHEYLERSL